MRSFIKYTISALLLFLLNSCGENYAVFFDKSAVTISSPSILAPSDPVLAEGTCEPDGSTINIFSSEIVGGSTQTTCVNGQYSVVLNLIDPGISSFSYRVELSGPSIDKSTDSQIVLINAPPQVNSPGNNEVINDSSPEFSGDSGSSIPGSTIVVSGPGGSGCTTTSSTNGSWSCSLSPPLPEGPSTISIIQTPPGESSSPATNIDIIVDTQNPSAPVFTNINNGSNVNNSTTAEGSCENDALVEISNAFLNPNPLSTLCTGGSFSIPLNFNAGADGSSQTLNLVQTDAAGNSSPTNSVTVSVNLSGPNAPTITSPSNGDPISSGTPLTGTCDGTLTISISSSDLNPNPTTGTCSGGSFSIPLNFLSGSNGSTSNLSVVQIDGGNSSSPTNISITIDDTNPSVTNITSSENNPTNASPIPLSIAFSEEMDLGSIAISDFPVSNGTLSNLSCNGDPTTCTLDLTPTGDGNVTVDMPIGAVDDLAGNSNTAAATQFVIESDTQAPPAAPITAGTTPASPTSDTGADLLVDCGTESSNGSVVVTTTPANGFTPNYGTTETLDSNGQVNLDSITWSVGTYDINLACNDAAGNGPTNPSTTPSVSIDDGAPSVTSITSTENNPTNASPIPLSITFSEEMDLGTIAISDFPVSNGTLSNLSCNGDPTTCTFDLTPTGDGNVTVDMPIGAVDDLAGNSNTAAATQFVIESDTQAPPAAPITAGTTPASPTSDTGADLLVDCGTESANGSVVVTTTPANGFTPNYGTTETLDSNGQVNLDSITWSVGTYDINLACSDAAGNGPVNPSTTPSITIDDGAPSVTSITSTENNPTNASPIPLSITFSEEMDLGTIAISDFPVSNGTLSNLSCNGDPTTCTFDLTPTGDGNVTVDMPIGAVDDLAGNSNTAAATQFVIESDTQAPPAAPITAGTTPASPTSDTGADLLVDCGTESSNGSVVVTTTPANGFTPNYGTTETLDSNGQVNLDSITWSVGTYDINLACNDAAGNGPTNPSTTPSVSIDDGAPSVTSITSTENNPTNASPIPLSITFSEEMDLGTIAISDFPVSNGTLSNLSCNGDPTTCTFDLTPTGDGNVTVDMPIGAVDDLAGNSNTAAATQFVIESDTQAPPAAPITAGTTPASPTSDTGADLLVDCGTESSNGSVVVTTTPANGFTPNYGTTETLDSNGQVNLDSITWSVGNYDLVLACSDAAGNGPTNPSTTPSITIDDGAPSVTSITSTESSPTNASPIPLSIAFSEEMDLGSIAISDFPVSNGTLSNLSCNGDPTTCTFDLTPTGDGNVTVDMPIGAVDDLAGNSNTAAATQFVIESDTQAPPAAPITAGTTPASPTSDTGADLLVDCGTESANGSVVVTTTPANGFTPNYGTTETLDSNGQVNLDSITWSVGTYDINLACSDAAGNGPTNPSTTPSVSIDDGAPSVTSITSTESSPTNASPIPLSIAFSEEMDLGSIAISDFPVSNGTLSNLSCNGDPTTCTFDLTPTGDGNVTVDMPIGAVDDLAGNSNTAAATQFVIESDTQAPPAAPITAGTTPASPTSDTGADLLVDCGTESSNGSVVVTTTPANGFTPNYGTTETLDSNGQVNLDSITWSVGTYDINLACNDAAGNGPVNPSTTPSITIDDGAPSVTSITSTENNPTNASPIPLSITFSEEMDLGTIAISDFPVSNGTLSNLSCNGDPTTCTFDLTPTGDGNVTVDMPIGAVDDLAGNSNTAAATQFVIESDTQAPPAAPITAGTTPASPTSDTGADLLVDCGTESSNGSVVVTTTPANGFTPNYGTTETLDSNGQVNLDSITWSVGTYDINLACNDAAGNGPTNPSTTPSVSIDDGAPSVTSITSTENNPTNASPIPLSITFSEEMDLSSISISDFPVSNGTLSNLSCNGDPTTCTFDLTPTGDGNITVDMPIGAVDDLAGNSNTAAATQFVIESDTQAPGDPNVISPLFNSSVPLSFTLTISCPENNAVININNVNLSSNPSLHTCTSASNENISLSFNSGTTGTQFLNIYAEDTAGNQSSSINHAVSIQTTCTPTWTNITPGNYRTQTQGNVALADIDNDSDLDILSSGVDGTVISYLYENDGNGNLTDITPSGLSGYQYSAHAFADIDGDGDQDLFSSGTTQSSGIQSHLYLGDGNGGFTDATPAAFVGQQHSGAAFADIDGDGDQDLAAVGENASNNPSIYLYENDGSGGYTDITPGIFVGLSEGKLAWTDIEGDGDPDLIVTGTAAGNTASTKLYENDGAGNFTDVTPGIFVALKFSIVASADFDNDGDEDILLNGDNSSSTRTVKLYLNDGTGTYTDSTPAALIGQSYGNLSIDDVDNDGDKDIISSGINSSGGGSLHLFINDGNANFTNETPAAFAGFYQGGMALGDIDGDLDPDLITNGYGAPASIYENSGCENAGGSSTVTSTIDAPTPQINANNESNYSFTGTCSEINEDVNITIDGNPVSPIPLCQAGGVYTLAAQDLSSLSSGNYEVTVHHCDSSGANCSDLLTENIVKDLIAPSDPIIVSPLANDSVSESFTLTVTCPEAGAVIQVENTNLINNPTEHTCVGSTNESFTVELTNGTAGTHFIQVSAFDPAGNESNTLFHPVDVQSSCSPTWSDITPAAFAATTDGDLDWADFDGDGDIDLLAGGSSTALKLYLNDGSGSFSDATPAVFSGNSRGESTDVGDVDGDGDLDIVSTGSNGSGVDINLYLNDGSANFTEATPAAFVPIGASTVEFADIDGDLDLDLIALGYGNLADEINLYENDGSAGFTNITPTVIEDSGSSGDADWADIDGDGDLDLLTSGDQFAGTTISTLLFSNDGSGNFTDITPLSFTDMTISASDFGDIDGDGDQDLIMIGSEDLFSGPEVVALLQNDGSGNFSDITPGILPALKNGDAKFIDVDGDGDLDLSMSGTNSSDTPQLLLFENDGSGAFTNITPAAFVGVNNSTIDWADVDGDGDFELIANGHDGSSNTLTLYEKDSCSSSVSASLTAPVPQINSNNQNAYSFTGSCSEINEAVNVTISGNAIIPAPLCQAGGVFSVGPEDLSSLAIGNHDITVYHCNASGSECNSLLTETIVKDVTDPASAPITASTTPASPTSDTGADLSINCGTDAANGSVVVTTSPANGFSPNYNTTESLDSNGQLNLSAITWTPGTYDIILACSDFAGNGPVNPPSNPSVTINGGGDSVPPEVVVSQGSSQSDPTTSQPIRFDIAFNEVINTSTFTNSDITFNGTAPGTPTYSISNTGDDMNFTVDVTGLTGSGTVVIDIAAGVVSDPSGNTNNASSSSDNSVQLNFSCTPSWTDITPGVFVSQSFSSLDWGDMDADGDPDLIAIGEDEFTNDTIYIYQNDGSGNFTDVTPGALAGSSNGKVQWADVDGDTDLDFVYNGSSGMFLYRNDGSNTFTDITPAAFVNQSNGSLAWGDIDGDLDLDLVAYGEESGIGASVYLYQNNGTGSFTDITGPSNLVGLETGSAEWADYDGDGDLDLAVSGSSSGTEQSHLYENNGSGVFTDTTPASFEPLSNSAVAWADIDGDLDPDLVTTGYDNSFTPAIYLYQNDGAGAFSDITPAAFEGLSLGDLKWADIDNDGDQDLVASGYDSNFANNIFLFRNDGSGTFTDITPAAFVGIAGAAGTGYSSMDWADIDGDGDLDLVGSGIDDSFNSTINLYENSCIP